MFEVADDVFDFHAGEAVVEGEGDGAVGDAFGDGEVAAFEAVVFHVEGLEVDGGGSSWSSRCGGCGGR